MDRTIPPRLHGIGDFTLPMPRRVFLDNGIPLIILESRDVEITRITVMTNGGTAEASSPAVAMLAAAMQNEGTPSMTSQQIAATTDFNGAMLGASAISHHTRTQLRALPTRIGDLLPLMVETMMEATIPEKELANVKGRLAGAAELRETTVEYQASRISAAATFGPEHPLAKPVTAQSINNVTREEILDFRRRYMRPDSMSIFASGAVSRDLINRLNSTFGAIPMPVIAPEPIFVKPFEPQFNARPRVEVADALQSAVSITFPTIGRENPDYLNLRLTVMGLGGYFGSRLQAEVREKQGLTYGISAQLLGYVEGGVVNIMTQCDNSSVDKVVESVVAEIKRLSAEPPSQSEMHRIAQSEFTTLLETTETPFSVTDFYISLHSAHLPVNYFEQRMAAAHCITPKIIANMAEKYLTPDKMIVAVAGATEC